MRLFDLLHPNKVEPTRMVLPPLTPQELALLQDDLRARERDGGRWPKEARDTAAAQAAYNLGQLYVRSGRIEDGVALWRASALFYESIDRVVMAIALWKAIQRDRPTAEAEERLAALSKRMGW